VEVWFPGVGWVSSDPTAGARRATARWSDLASLGRNPFALGLVGLLVCALVVVGLLRRRRRVGSPSVSSGPPAPRRAVPAELAAAFARLEAALVSAGAGRRPVETVAELGRRVDAVEPLSVLERALYAKDPPSRAECAEAAAALDRVSTALLSVQA
jgi:hypothetical protein